MEFTHGGDLDSHRAPFDRVHDISKAFRSELRQFRDERMISMKESRNWELKDVRAVFSDIDGTLLDSEERLTSENLNMIQEIVHRGILMVFASGRSTRSIRNFQRTGNVIQTPLPSKVLSNPERKVISKTTLTRPLLRK